MIVVRLLGGLGNQMFQYSAGLALALKHSVPLRLDTTSLLDRTPNSGAVFRGFDLDVFTITAQIAQRSEIPFWFRRHANGRLGRKVDRLRRQWFPHQGSERAYHADSRFHTFGPNTYLEGFWQSPAYFDHCRDAIKREFTLKDELPAVIREYCDHIRNADSVCLNVRRGDFVGSSFHGTMPIEYYSSALAIIGKRHDNPKVFVFSDDIEWCHNNLTLAYETVFMDHRYAGPKFSYYFALMQACKAFVIPNSSFAWWAAWLNSDIGKIVVAPKKWFQDSSRNTRDLIPATWIRI
jgi:hypothetical protein